jgi:hypothetical protein
MIKMYMEKVKNHLQFEFGLILRNLFTAVSGGNKNFSAGKLQKTFSFTTPELYVMLMRY